MWQETILHLQPIHDNNHCYINNCFMAIGFIAIDVPLQNGVITIEIL
jgi:hypothetical protein